MNEIEDRLRAAAQAAADTVPSGSAPPLRLPAGPGGRFSLLSRLGPTGGRMIIAPVAAAAAVAAVVTVSLVVTGGASRSGPARSGPAPALSGSVTSCATASASASATPSAPDQTDQGALASVPPYYVALTRMRNLQNVAVVRDTATGAELATLSPPSPYGMFTAVTAAADDSTFILAATPSPSNQNLAQDVGRNSTAFFLLCLNAAGQPTTGLTALPITAGRYGVDVTGMALSPDASKLAVIVSTGKGDEPGNSDIVIFTLATGSATEWRWPASGWIGNWKPEGSPLSWTANGQTLAFQAWQEHETQRGSTAAAPRASRPNVKVTLTTQVRLLDAAGAGGSLATSTLTVEWAMSGSLLLGTNTIITPDGSKIVCVTATQSSLAGVVTSSPNGAATEYSVATGKVVGFLGGEQPVVVGAPGTRSEVVLVQDVLWSNATGSTLIVATSTGAGVLTGDQFTPIPGYQPLTWNVAW